MVWGNRRECRELVVRSNPKHNVNPALIQRRVHCFVFMTTAQIDEAFYTVVWTWRGQSARNISVRRARDAER